MNKGTALALALGSGYFLGRTKKLRLAMMVGGAIATGKAGSVGAGLLKRGVGGLGQNSDLGGLSPALGEISGALKGNLANAAKAATMTAVTSRANALADIISDQADALRAGGAADDGSGEDRESEDAGEDRESEVADDGNDRRSRQADDRRGPRAHRDDSTSKSDGRPNRRGEGRTTRSDQSKSSDQGQSRSNGRRHSGAESDKRARQHAAR